MSGVRDQLLGRDLYLLRFWGADAPAAVAVCPMLVAREPEDGPYYARFPDNESREEFMEVVRGFGGTVVLDPSDGPSTLYRTVAVVDLVIDAAEYTIQHGFGFGYDDEAARYMFQEGNYACDCNLSLFIRHQQDPNFPTLPCGNRLRIRSLRIDHR